VWADRVTIDLLPDEVLLYIFHFDVSKGVDRLRHMSDMTWLRLVHVCQKWRSIVLASPRFLDLRIVCGPGKCMELIGIWPPLPIVFGNGEDGPTPEDDYFDAAIVHHNRICEIDFHLGTSQFQRLASVMQEPFPALINLRLENVLHTRPPPVLPDGFLGGSAPRLQTFKLEFVAFPALPKLLLSATSLVHLSLWHIPYSGYIPPEVIVSCLAVLTNLIYLAIEFTIPQSRPDLEYRHSPPPTRTVLPALIHFELRGVSEYVEGLVARIDTPFLDALCITFFHQLTFDIPQLAQFMRRTTRFQALIEAHVDFDYGGIHVESLPQIYLFNEMSGFSISCNDFDWQLSSVANALTSFFPSIYIVERLYISGCGHVLSQWQDDIDNSMQLLEIFRPFSSVKHLYVNKDLAQRIAPALRELVGERVTDVLPALESLFLEELQALGPIWDAIEQFVAARQLLGHPIAISDWNDT
jgi:F-box-like